MNLKNCIKMFDFIYLQDRINAKDWDSTSPFFEMLSKRTFSVADTGVDRKLLHYWNKMGVVPFQKSKGWDKFSFIEVCWLKFLYELKSLDVGIKNIQLVKKFFIDDKEFMFHLYGITKDSAREDNTLPMSDGKFMQINEAFIDQLMDNQYVKFSILLLIIILKKSNTCIYIERNGHIGTFEVNALQENPIVEIPLWINFFSEKSVTITNLTSIITAITETHELFTIKDNMLYIQESAIAIIKKMFQENQISEITIRLSNDARPLLTITKKLTFEQLNQKINTLQRKGVFMDMTLKTRDGKLQHFETSELIKL